MASKSSGLAKQNHGVWLMGPVHENFTGSKLPSNQQVLGRFFYHHFTNKKKIHESATATTVDILEFWEKARIPTLQKQNVIIKIEKLNEKWIKLKKNKKIRSKLQQQHKGEFTDALNDLFDIAHQDALKMITIPEDKEFLLAQREKGRRGCMGSVDKKMQKREENRNKRTFQAQCRVRRENERKIMVVKKPSLTDTCSESDQLDDTVSDFEQQLVDSQAQKKIKTVSKQKNIVTPELASALDRTRMSNRSAAFLLAATAESLGHNSQNYSVNRESIRKYRRKYREEIAREILLSFKANVPLVIHWDGKMMPSLTSKESVDRLAVLVSGQGITKLLGVPMIDNGTGET